jgi:hypothetical protein
MIKATKSLFGLCLVLFVLQAYGSNYFLISELEPVTFYRCLKQAGVNDVGIIV